MPSSTARQGIPLAVSLTRGNRNDITQLLPLLVRESGGSLSGELPRSLVVGEDLGRVVFAFLDDQDLFAVGRPDPDPGARRTRNI
jgi:hypothetical protein